MHLLRKYSGLKVVPALAIAVMVVLAGLTSPMIAHAENSAEQVMTGDPYDLNGNRIVFTNWHYVRPGIYAWKDAAGNNVTANRDPALGPWDAQHIGVDIPRGIRLVAQPAERGGPILLPKGPWDKHGLEGRALLHEQGKFRLWASVSLPDGKTYGCIFESGDGRKWTKPVLNLVDVEGSTENNFFPNAPTFVFIDPSAPESARYKGVALDSLSREDFETFKKQRPDAWEHRADRGDFISGIFGYVSPDGIAWKRLPDPLAIEHSDTDIVAHYDNRRNMYVMYTRNYHVGSQSPRVPNDPSIRSWLGDAGGAGRRSIGRSESSRFDAFPLSDLLTVPDPGMLPSEVLYSNAKTTIPGAPDQHLMFPAVWDIATDTTRIVMASSHDGAVWNYVPGGDVLRTADFGQWDGGCIFTLPNLIELPDGSFVLPYKGYSVPHKYPRGQWVRHIGLAVWPRGRIVALEAEDRGEFATVRIMPPGRKLLINAVTRRVGSIRVEVADKNGNPLPGRSFEDAVPIQGDQYRTVLQWGDTTDLGYAEGEPIILRFRMDRARLFSLDFE